MDAIGLLHYSLKSAFEVLGSVTADLTQEQADWQPPGIANPIGATYWHALSGTDDIVHRWCQDQEPLAESGDWEAKVLTVSAPEPEHGGDWLPYMQAIRVDLPSAHAYAQAVAESVGEFLASLAPDDLDRKIETPFQEFALGELLELFVIWHLNAHCGEIAALKGCQGAKGYPF
jgi:hypothetical protein